jgi:hypothetical protein
LSIADCALDARPTSILRTPGVNYFRLWVAILDKVKAGREIATAADVFIDAYLNPQSEIAIKLIGVQNPK